MSPDLFDACYQEWGARIRNQARRMAQGDADLADDLAQEGLVRLSQFGGHALAKTARGHVWRVLRNHMFNEYRREQRARVIGGRQPRGAVRRRRRTAPRHRAASRARHHIETGPQHPRAAPMDVDGETEVWHVR
ncbi:MAG TPA: sigma factor [Gemmatimonadaceae bacterium]|jgi:DNA-directed RNA polymerase specialized sigma24 family protein|nr:sigma factor [Gemmatimonadaceae bacterium]